MLYAAPTIALGGLLLMSTTVFAAGPNAEYFGDLQDRVIHLEQGWGEIGINAAAHETGLAPAAIRINGRDYANGIGTHANGDIVLDLDRQYDLFEAEAGVQWQDGDPNRGSVVFRVYADNKLAFDSGVMRQTGDAKPVKVSVKGARELRLSVRDAGDGIACDAANWAEARLTRTGSPPTPTEPMDIAPFARVFAWDPARMDGVRVTRVQEFPADDLFAGTDLRQEIDGYSAPSYAGSLNCIGLEWPERRRLREVGLQLSTGANLPLDQVQVQAWVGESKWQGGWQPIVGKIEQAGDTLTMRVSYTGNAFMRPGTPKLRWILPGSGSPIKVRRLWANTTSRCENTDLALTLEKPRPVDLEVYNGYLEGGATKRTWDGKGTLRLSVRSCDTTWSKLDRTVLRLHADDTALAVAIDDVLTHDRVYVPDAGVFVASGSSKLTIDEHRKSIAGRETVLERVRKMPDQTLEQAMTKTRNPIQDHGPTMLSLACDNHKFVVERDGAVKVLERGDLRTVFPFGWLAEYDLLTPRFGSGKNEGFSRHLDGGWLPLIVNSVREGGVTYSQRTAVVPSGEESFPQPARWLNSKPLCLVQFTIENTSSAPADASLSLDFAPGKETDQAVDLRGVANGAIAQLGGRLLVWLDLADMQPLSARVDGTRMTLAGSLPAGKRATCVAYIPAWEADPDERAQLANPDKLFAGLRDYWDRAIAPSMRIELPDKFVEGLIRASQVHCLIAARSEENGERVAPWISATCYGPLESEANSIIEAMCLMGQQEFVCRSLDYFIHRYKPEGYMTTGYTLMGMGWHLWSLGDYYKLYRDASWLKANAAKVDRLCRWIVAQTEKTRKLDANGNQVLEYGLIPPGNQADWNAWAYHFSQNGYYYVGLEAAARALAEAGVADAASLKRGADDLRQNILRAYAFMREITPVLPLKDGTWVRAYPSQLFTAGPLGYFFAGEDANRSWCYDVELGAHQLVPHGLLDPMSVEVNEMLNHMEDVQFLGEGWFDYPAERNEKDWYNLGGFSKVQPYYTRNCEIYAMRDDVKPFVRSYFNTLSALVNTENMSFWEHFHTTAAWNKTHETGYFLQQSRFMLAMEHGDELWLAPFITSNWLKDGMVVAATDAPTAFGPVSFRITSHVAQDHIDATIILSPSKDRPAPSKLVLRLRHPDGKPMRSVTIDGEKHADFDPTKEAISIKPAGEQLAVRAEF